MVKISSKDKKVGHCPLGQGKILDPIKVLIKKNLDTGPPNNISSQISKL
jgi:hypothetical protein